MEEQTTLNPLDIIIIAGILFGMYLGAKKGIFKISTRIIGVVLSLIAALRMWWVAENLYLDVLKLQLSSSQSMALSFATIFVVSYIVVSTVIGQLAKGLDKTKINIDDALGALFGGLSATLVLSIAFILLSYVNFPTQANAQGSILYPHVRDFSRYALGTGVKALNEASKQINKYGLNNQLPAEKPTSKQNQQPSNAPESAPSGGKPSPVR